MKRVLHIQMTKSIGGIAAVQRNLLNHIDRSRYLFDFVTTYPDAALIPYVEPLGANIFTLPPERTVISYCVALYRLVKRERYEIVHIHKNACANPMALMVCKLAGVKYIIVHAHNTGSISGKGADCLHYLFRPLFGVLANGRIACGKEAGYWMFGNKRPFSVLKNGIDLSAYTFRQNVRDRVRKELGVEDKLVIGHVGNYIPQKNHRFVIDILEEILKLCPEVVLLLVGRGEAMETMKAYAQGKGLSEHVRFLGARTDVAELYQGMDVFLFPSLHEGFPVVGVEAQTAGLPCAFSDAITEDVVLTKTAVRIPLTLPAKQWAEQVLALTKTAKRVESAAQMLQSDFSAEKMAQALEEIYEKGLPVCPNTSSKNRRNHR